MKNRVSTEIKTNILNNAIDKINSANSRELDEIVSIIEKYGRKKENAKVYIRQGTTVADLHESVRI